MINRMRAFWRDSSETRRIIIVMAGILVGMLMLTGLNELVGALSS